MAAPDTWEYRTRMAASESDLNHLGADGWELVGISDGVFYLKRPIQSFRERVTLEQKQRYFALWGKPLTQTGTEE